MERVALYFPDSINLKAFLLLENVAGVHINDKDSLLTGKLQPSQIERACVLYGAIRELPGEKF